MSIIQNEYARGSVVFDCDYRTGSIADKSPYKAAATVRADAIWARNRLGYAISFRGDGLVSYASNTANKLVGSNATFVIFGDFSRPPASQRFISKNDASGNSYDIFSTTTGASVTLQSGVTSSLFSSSVVGRKLLVFTLVNGAAPLLYLDGVYASTGNAAISIADYSAPLNVGNYYTLAGARAQTQLMQRVVILNRALSAQEISQLYQELMSERYPLRAYSFGCRISAPKDPPGVAALLKTDFTTRLADGRLADLSGNGWHGTVKPGFAAGPGMCGNALMANSASRTYVDFGDVMPINGASKLTVLWYGASGTRSPTEIMFDKGTGAGARFDFAVHPTVPTWYIGGKYCTISDTNVGTPQCFALRYNGELDNANKAQIFRDGAPVTVTPQADMPSALSNTAGTPLVVGRLSWANANPPLAKNDFFAIYPAALTPEQVGYVYKQIARRSTFALDMQRVPVSLANMVGPCEVPGTPFRVNNGTWKVSEDTAGKHWFESVATNSSSIYMPSTQAFGTWVFEVYHTSASEYVFFTCSSPSIATGKTGYSVNLGGTALSLNRYDASGPTTLCSASNAIAVGNKYTLAVTRSSPSEFTLLMIVGGKWTKVAATSGANPVTDATYKTSSFFTCAIFTAANAGKFGNVRIFAGPLTRDMLREHCP